MTLRSVLSRIALQVLTRGATFGLNVAIVRTVSRDAVGLAFQLEVLLQMLMFLPREGLRNALLRVRGSEGAGSDVDARAWRRTIDLAWLFIALSPLVALIICAMFTRGLVADGAGADAAAMRSAVAMYGASSVVELLSLPLVVLCERIGLVSQRVAIEGFAVVLRALVTSIGVLALGDTVRSYGAGQLVFAATFSGGLYLYWACCRSRPSRELLPTPLRRRCCGERGTHEGELTPAELAEEEAQTGCSVRVAGALRRMCGLEVAAPELALTFVLAAQAAWKWLLTHGEKVLLVLFAVPSAQGGYQLVSNLGSLALRFLFFPIEEQAATDFARFAPAVSALAAGRAVAVAKRAATTGGVLAAAPSAADADRLGELRGKLVTSVRIVVLLACVLAALAPAYAFAAVDILYGARYSGAPALAPAAAVAAGAPATHGVPRLLAWYAWYVLTMALNGVLEAFVRAVASKGELVRYNGALPVISLVYAVLAWRLFTVQALGIVGLLAANCVNMVLRAALAFRFARRVFARAAAQTGVSGLAFGVRDVAPSVVTLATLVAAAALTMASDGQFRAGAYPGGDPSRWSARVVHIAVGLCALLSICAALRVGEADLLRLAGRRRSGTRGKAE